jgi:hypothetical protein
MMVGGSTWGQIPAAVPHDGRSPSAVPHGGRGLAAAASPLYKGATAAANAPSLPLFSKSWAFNSSEHFFFKSSEHFWQGIFLNLV